MNTFSKIYKAQMGGRIIGYGTPEVSVRDIKAKMHRLPDLYMDALQLKYGLNDYDPISEKEIAEIFSDENRIKMNGDLVSGIINDALFMIDHDPAEFDPIVLSEVMPAGLPGSLCGKELSWNMVLRKLWDYTDENDLENYLSEAFGDADYVIVPWISDIYFSYSPRWTDVAGFDTELTAVEVLDYRGMAEFMIEKLDKMGICIVSNLRCKKEIRPEDIYQYAYLDTDLAMKIIHDNPVKLIEKIGQSRCN